MKKLLWLSLGWLLGVVSVAIYEIFGKPVLPTEPEDIPVDKHGYIRTPEMWEEIFDRIPIMNKDSLSDLDDTQEIKLRDEPAEWVHEITQKDLDKRAGYIG